jgi:hypothetical protein
VLPAGKLIIHFDMIAPYSTARIAAPSAVLIIDIASSTVSF